MTSGRRMSGCERAGGVTRQGVGEIINLAQVLGKWDTKNAFGRMMMTNRLLNAQADDWRSPQGQQREQKRQGLSILSFHCMLFYIKNTSRYAEVFYKFSIGCHV